MPSLTRTDTGVAVTADVPVAELLSVVVILAVPAATPVTEHEYAPSASVAPHDV